MFRCSGALVVLPCESGLFEETGRRSPLVVLLFADLELFQLSSGALELLRADDRSIEGTCSRLLLSGGSLYADMVSVSFES